MIGDLGSEPWFPTLAWLINHKENYDGSGSIDFRKYGWDALVVPDDCIYVKSRMSTLEVRFNQRYMMRLLSQETLENWQIRLQNRFDELVHTMERAYSIYAEHETSMDRVLPGETTETEGSSTDSGSNSRTGSGTSNSTGSGTSGNTQGGSDSSTAQGINSDTPDTAINTSVNYAGSTTKQDNTVNYGKTENGTYSDTGNSEYSNTDTTNYGKKTDITGKTTVVKTGADIVANINKSIDEYRDLDTMFVAGFENNFLNIFWY